MKRYLISTIAILVVLAVVLVSFGQEERARRRRMGREERLKAIEVIEAHLAKLKESPAFSREGFQNFRNMSEDEQAKFIERMTKALQEQRKIYQTIMGQLASLQGRREPAPEGAQYLIISTADLKPIQETATKEKAKETSQLLERLIARGSDRGFGRRRGPQGDQGSQRSTGREQ